jgi:ABC-type anion transport system duplicated permease subunit
MTTGRKVTTILGADPWKRTTYHTEEAANLNDHLQATLEKMMQSGSWSNPAMNTLITDYTRYHVVLVVACSFLAVIFILLSIVFWTRWKKVLKTDQRQWSFEKRTYFTFAVVSAVVGLLIALIAVVNATNVVDARQGFSCSWILSGHQLPDRQWTAYTRRSIHGYSRAVPAFRHLSNERSLSASLFIRPKHLLVASCSSFS